MAAVLNRSKLLYLKARKSGLIKAMMTTGIGVVLGLGAIVHAASQINTGWLTTFFSDVHTSTQ